jgi:cation diffusion facilitator CzcD-associated flavoprotein CzcO
MRNLEELHFEIVVVGAGVGGIAAAIKLREAGITDFVVLDREHGVGGTWWTQTYPGLTIDIPSLTYSFSFEQKADWSSVWAPADEMREYCRHCVDKYGVADHFRLGVTVTAARYDEQRNQWVLDTEDGRSIAARYLINASGFLSQPKWPDIPGLADFAGTKLHTSRWPADIDLAGRRVAFIGTGATAIQLAPQIAGQVAQLDVYQRTPIWLLPKPPMRFAPGVQRAFARVPGLQRAARLSTAAFMDLVFFQVFGNYRRMGWFGRLMEVVARQHIRKQVSNPDTREALTPRYSWGCKRPSFSNDFYPIFNESHVDLVTAPISRITSHGVETADGLEHPADILVCATGYQPFERSALPTYPVYGRGGLELQEFWDENRYQAFRGFTVHGFPNFFLIFGPYATASSSYIAGVELSVRNIVTCLRTARRKGADYIEVSKQAQRAEFDRILARKPNAIWNVGNCGPSHTYYIDRHGDTPTFRPSTHPREWWASRRPDLEPFTFRRGVAASTAPANGAPAEHASAYAQSRGRTGSSRD